jgi:acyl-CoA reductase-like NAD-dependent aldehyde dehydrogenase
MGTDRIIVHEAIASQFLTALKDGLENAAKSHGTLMTIVSSASKTRLAYLVENALSEGASVAWGVDESRSLPGTSFVPTILQGVKSSARIWNEETFGPLAVFSTVTTDEEAIGLVNDTEYGLSAAVFTRDLRRGIAMAKKIEAG